MVNIPNFRKGPTRTEALAGLYIVMIGATSQDREISELAQDVQVILGRAVSDESLTDREVGALIVTTAHLLRVTVEAVEAAGSDPVARRKAIKAAVDPVFEELEFKLGTKFPHMGE